MDLETLKIFDTVASELSMTRAAERLGRVPSNITTRIQHLEAELGAALFIRSGKRITLSTAGQRFWVYAQRMMALADEARHAVGGGGQGGTLRIGSMESTAASRLPGPLAAYHHAYPTTRLEVSTGPSAQLMEQVRHGSLDCAFVALPLPLNDDAGVGEMGLESLPLWRESIQLLLPSVDHEATTLKHIRTRSLATFKPGCTYRAMAEQCLGIVPGGEWHIQELGSYHAMIAAVAAGSCVALLPLSVLELCRVPGVSTLDVGPVTTHLIWRRGYDIPAFQAFCQFFSHG